MLELKKVNNYGIGGTRIAHQGVPSEKPRYDLCFCGRAYNMERNADIIVVYVGVNDYIYGDAYFGKLTDKTPATFCGGVDFLMRLLQSEYGGAKIVFMTPAHMQYDDLYDTKASERPMKKSDAKPLYEYVKVIIGQFSRMGGIACPIGSEIEFHFIRIGVLVIVQRNQIMPYRALCGI